MLRITEIFHSLQGESNSVGLPTVFIRLTGCPLRCVYCDTAYAFTGGEKIEIDSTRISLVKCTDRAILMDFLQTFGGNWQKEINYWDKTKINYFQEITIREYLKYKIEANGAEPPASCRIVEEEVIVPEHKEMKKKLICEKEESEVKE